MGVQKDRHLVDAFCTRVFEEAVAIQADPV
jgi:hypothetical protein